MSDYLHVFIPQKVYFVKGLFDPVISGLPLWINQKNCYDKCMFMRGAAVIVMLISLVFAPLFLGRTEAKSIEIYSARNFNFDVSKLETDKISDIGDFIATWNIKLPGGGLHESISYGIEYYEIKTPGEKMDYAKCKSDTGWKRFSNDHKVLEYNRTTGDIKWQLENASVEIQQTSYFRLVHVNMFGYRKGGALACDDVPIEHGIVLGKSDIYVNFQSQPSGAKVTVHNVVGVRDSAPPADICKVWTCVEGDGTTPTKVKLRSFHEPTGARITFTHPEYGTKTIRQDRMATNNMVVKAIFDSKPDTVAITVNSTPEAGMVVTIDGHAPTSADGGKTATNLVLRPPRDTASPAKKHTLVLKDPATGKQQIVTLTFDKDDTITWDTATDKITKTSDTDPDIAPEPEDPSTKLPSSEFGKYEDCNKFLLDFFRGGLGKFAICQANNLALGIADLASNFVPNAPY